MSYDAIVAGGGHNGLVCAARLASAGMRVAVLERRARTGGLVDGVLTDAARLDRDVARAAGVTLADDGPALVALREGADPVAFWDDPDRTAASLAPVSAADAAAWPRLDAHVRALGGFLGELAEVTPPRLDRGAVRDWRAGVRLARAYRRLDARTARELTRALPMAAADFAGEWLADDGIRAAVASRGSRFTTMGPWSAGSAAVLLMDSAGGGGGAAGRAAHVEGGPAALAAALDRMARAAGADVRTGAEVASVLVRDDRVAGVRLAGGEELEAGVVACAVDPKTVLTRWVDPEVAGPRLRWRAGNIRTAGATAVVELDVPAGLPFAGRRFVVAPGIDAVERAFDAWKYGELPEQPLLEVHVDGHVLRVLAQWVPHDAAPEAVGDAVLAELRRHMPDLDPADRRVLTPSGIEAEFGLSGGHVHHAEPGLDQFFAWRPVLGMARYRLPVRGLYLCGPGAHPGGGITGLPGRNAAREILRDVS